VMVLTETELIGRVIEWVRENSPIRDRVDGHITPDSDLFESGFLDSLGFVDLITFIETHEGCRVDLTNADPSEFAVLKGLCRLALKNSPLAEHKSTI
jgi:acyl carrier protein